MAFQLISDTVI